MTAKIVIHINNTAMEYKEFVELVKKMREAQKNYFRTRDYNYLSESKKIERQVFNKIIRL